MWLNNIELFFLTNWYYPDRGVILLIVRNKVKLKWSRYRPGVAQRVGRGIAVLFHDRDTRRGWVFSSTPRPHFTPGEDPVPIVQEAGWAPGPVWTGGKFRPHRDSIPDRPARSQSLYRLSYPAHYLLEISKENHQECDLCYAASWSRFETCTSRAQVPKPSYWSLTYHSQTNFHNNLNCFPASL